MNFFKTFEPLNCQEHLLNGITVFSNCAKKLFTLHEYFLNVSKIFFPLERYVKLRKK